MDGKEIQPSNAGEAPLPSSNNEDASSKEATATPVGRETSAVNGASASSDDAAVPRQGCEATGGIAVAEVVSNRETENDSTAKEPKPATGIKQRRRDKRKAGWERKKRSVKEAKHARRQKREDDMRRAGIEIPPEGKLWRDLPPEQWSVSQKIRMAKKKEFDELAQSGGYRICVDMDFGDLMLEKARASMVQQILYLYGSNKKATQPCLVTLSGMGPVMTTAIHRLSGFDTWLGVTTDSRCYSELFEKDELVYLSADSPNTINQLLKGKVYIIGGIVDRNAHKGLCFEKAKAQGITTARLPLEKGDLNGSASKVLATNHVFDILVRAMESGGDLQKVEHQMLPPRKRAGWTGGSNRTPKSNKAFDNRDSSAEAGDAVKEEESRGDAVNVSSS